MVELLELIQAGLVFTAVALAVPAMVITGTDVPDIEPLLDPPQVVDKTSK
jgi:hypothetical protein